MEAAGSRNGVPSGVLTGFTDLDALTGGLRPGHLTVIAARPAMGTSTLALNFLGNAAIGHNLPAVLFTYESDRKEVGLRILSAEARVALHHMRSGTMTDDDWVRLARRIPEVSEAPLYIQDDGGPRTRPSEPSAAAWSVNATSGSSWSTTCRCSPTARAHWAPGTRRYRKFPAVSNSWRRTQRSHRRALQEQPKGAEQRTDEKPMLTDLRDSGALEDNADLVILLHREDAYEKDSPRAGEADLIIPKHRQGPTATITVAFQGHYSRFVDMAYPAAAKSAASAGHDGE